MLGRGTMGVYYNLYSQGGVCVVKIRIFFPIVGGESLLVVNLDLGKRCLLIYNIGDRTSSGFRVFLVYSSHTTEGTVRT